MRPTAGQLLNLLGLLRNMPADFDAIQVANAYGERFAVSLDWHDIAMILDILCTQGWIARSWSATGRDGMTVYRIL